MEISFTSIGFIHTPFTNTEGMPIQPAGAEGVCGTVEVRAEYAEGLSDLEGFSHIILIYYFHDSSGYKLKVIPFLDETPRGVFSTRAPRRPNAIGLSIVRLNRIEGTVLHVENTDILDGTPLLDIKPYVPEFDHHQVDSFGWLEKAQGRVASHKSDNRFRKATPKDNY